MAAAEAGSDDPGRAQKRPRPAPPRLDLLKLCATLPKDLATPCGDTLNVALLKLVGSQAAAACCRAALEWWTLGDRRLVLTLDDECRGQKGPFALLERLAAGHVEWVRLGRYGRRDIDESVRVVASCSRAVSLRCVYAKLAGIGAKLEQQVSQLTLRRLRFHQCRLQAGDVSRLLRLAPHLESADLYGEALAGLGEELEVARVSCPALRSIEFTDCGLTAKDAAALLGTCGSSLGTAHFQANSLQGFRPPSLPALRSLSLLDCRLSRADTASTLAQCPGLESLSLCGNPLGAEDDEEDAAPSRWPSMPALLSADFRNCELDSEDEAELREVLPGRCRLEVQLQPATEPAGAAGGGAAGRHIIFEDSSDGE